MYYHSSFPPDLGNAHYFFIAEFYEEALSLVYDLTSKSISPDMWKVLELMYQVSDCHYCLIYVVKLLGFQETFF
jgi:hypothetical protein